MLSIDHLCMPVMSSCQQSGTQSNEVILSVLDCQVMTPVPTRWNSYYDARQSLLLDSSDKINELCHLCVALVLLVFKDIEFAIMK